MSSPHQKLTRKQQRFVAEYTTDFNGARAARDAGYSDRSAKEIASINLTKDNITQAVEAEITAKQEQTETSAEYILEQIRGIADRNYGTDQRLALDALKELGKLLGLYIERRITRNENIEYKLDLSDPMIRDAALNLARLQAAKDNPGLYEVEAIEGNASDT